MTLLHVHNARIWTAFPQRPWASSLTMNAGKIMQVDGDPPSNAEVIDVEGRTIIPGLIDAHMHLLLGAEALSQLDLSGVDSREAFERGIADHHAALAPGEWLVATGWSSDRWPGGALPDKSWLAAAGDRPAVCYRMDLHAVVANEAVLAQCDLANDPPGGRIVRDAQGQPTGLLLEAAAWKRLNPLVPKLAASQLQERLRTAMAHANGLGLTAVGTMEYAANVASVLDPLRDQLTLRCRVTLLDRDWPLSIDFGRDFHNDDRLAVIGYKSFADGTYGSRTARMLADYSDDPGNRGMLIEHAEQGVLQEWTQFVAENGFSPSIHAIGDEAVRLALDAVHAVDPSCRPRLEHVQHVDGNDISRFGQVIASMQPLHKADDACTAEKKLGQARLGGVFAFSSLERAGARLAFGSDWPVASCDPLSGVRIAVTGLTYDGGLFGTEQNISVESALRAYTAGAAYALQLDDAGVIRTGALGDLVMLDRDPFDADWADAPPQVLMTVMDGCVVYDGR